MAQLFLFSMQRGLGLWCLYDLDIRRINLHACLYTLEKE